jgi:hypothetical protein
MAIKDTHRYHQKYLNSLGYIYVFIYPCDYCTFTVTQESRKGKGFRLNIKPYRWGELRGVLIEAVDDAWHVRAYR